VTYFTLYVILLPVTFLLCFIIKNKALNKIPFFLIILVGLIRYDTTTDYISYVESFRDIRENVYNGHFEVGFIELNKIFSFSKWGFIPMLMVSMLIPYIQVYKIFKKQDILVIGSFLFLIFGYFTRFENIVRQGISIGIFYYIVNFAIRGKYIYYLSYSIIAFLFHSSALILLPYYFLIKIASRLKPNLILSAIILLTFFVFYLSNVSQLIVGLILNNLPFYENYLTDIDFGLKHSGLLLFFKLAVAWLPIFVFRNKKKTAFLNLILNLSWISALGNLIAQDFIVLDRIFEYLYLFQLVAISLMLKDFFIKKRSIHYGVILLFLFSFMHYRNINSYYTDNSYQSIFSENCKRSLFYKRYHRWEVINFDATVNSYRKTIVKIRND
jgi:hypothetical protein